MANSEQIDCSLSKIPFKTSLSFEYLIDEIKKISLKEAHPLQQLAKEIIWKLDEAPVLKKTITDRSVLNKNQSLVNQMMAFVFNPLNDTMDLAAAFPPFEMHPIYSTQLFDSTLKGEHRKLEMAEEIDHDKMLIAMLYQAYLAILEHFYDFRIGMDFPFTFKMTDEKNKTVKYFKKKINANYIRIKPLGRFKKLTSGEIKDLINNAHNLDLWNEKIPLEKFEFNGFLHSTYIDVTHDYVISELKTDLLDKNTIISQTGFYKIREKIRALIENPFVEFGLAASSKLDSSHNKNFVWNTIIPQPELKCEDYLGTVYEQAFVEKRIVLTDDFELLKKDKVVKAFLQKGIRSHAVIPLVLEDEVVGMLEFGCEGPEGLSMLQIKRLYDLFPIFALALKRSKEEWNDKVRAIIQEEFTAIHPTVEWRFREAVANLLDENSEKEPSGIEPIIFSDIVPIYGASDIRGSSVERNIAIQADLTEQLEHARTILEKGKQKRKMPLLDNLEYEIDKHLQTVNSGLKAGDEVSIVEFLKKGIDPVLLLLKGRYKEMVEPVDKYFQELDPELGVLYKRRKDFENSLTLINDKVGEIIDKEQVKAQQVFPHYFEKYRTDGLEYNGYIGQSLVKDFIYDDIYLKNIRLWQLLVKVKVAHEIRKLQPSLKTKLDITQLILVHSNPLSIAFRQDEKKFDVAGAYNIRYEITKKRIDKAMIRGTNERLTQVGKIAVIYSHADEIEEYKRYIDYMISQGFLNDSVEYIELEDLKGASGLKALRIEINFSEPDLNEDILFEEIKKVVEQV